MNNIVILTRGGRTKRELENICRRNHYWTQTINPVDFAQDFLDVIRPTFITITEVGYDEERRTGEKEYVIGNSSVDEEIENGNLNLEFEHISKRLQRMECNLQEGREGFCLFINGVSSRKTEERVKEDFGAFSLAEFGEATAQEIFDSLSGKSKLEKEND